MSEEIRVEASALISVYQDRTSELDNQLIIARAQLIQVGKEMEVLKAEMEEMKRVQMESEKLIQASSEDKAESED